jgi:PEP-CTERM motif
VRRWQLFASMLGFGVALASPAAVHAVTIIDSFDEPPTGQVVTLTNPAVGGTDTDTQIGLTGVAGGTRDLTLTAQAVFAGGSQAQAEINLATSPGNFQLTNSIRIDSVVQITWDANDAGLNLDLSGEASILLSGVENDLATSYTITLNTSGGGASSLTLMPGAGFSGDLDFAFSSFGGSVNFADIDSIVLEIDGVRGADVIIDSIVAVPEPGTAAALGVGLAGLAWLGRRRSLPA